MTESNRKYRNKRMIETDLICEEQIPFLLILRLKGINIKVITQLMYLETSLTIRKLRQLIHRMFQNM